MLLYLSVVAETVARRCSEKGVLRSFAKFTGKHLCQSLFFNNVAGLRPVTLLKAKVFFLRILQNF